MDISCVIWRTLIRFIKNISTKVGLHNFEIHSTEHDIPDILDGIFWVLEVFLENRCFEGNTFTVVALDSCIVVVLI
jgi:hypothetical protein